MNDKGKNNYGNGMYDFKYDVQFVNEITSISTTF
jgi:hypothetical protein